METELEGHKQHFFCNRHVSTGRPLIVNNFPDRMNGKNIPFSPRARFSRLAASRLMTR